MKTYLSYILGGIVGVAVMTYHKHHPDLNSYTSVENSWLAPEEKLPAIERIVRLTCDQEFRKAFIPGTTVIADGLDEVVENIDSYSLLRNVSLINAGKGYTGMYICTYHKNGNTPFLNVNLEGATREILKRDK